MRIFNKGPSALLFTLVFVLALLPGIAANAVQLNNSIGTDQISSTSVCNASSAHMGTDLRNNVNDDVGAAFDDCNIPAANFGEIDIRPPGNVINSDNTQASGDRNHRLDNINANDKNNGGYAEIIGAPLLMRSGGPANATAGG